MFQHFGHRLFAYLQFSFIYELLKFCLYDRKSDVKLYFSYEAKCQLASYKRNTQGLLAFYIYFNVTNIFLLSSP